MFTDCKVFCLVHKEHHYKHVRLTLSALITLTKCFHWLRSLKLSTLYQHVLNTITNFFNRLRNLLLSTWEKAAPSVAREECPPPWTSPASSGTFRTRGPLFNKFWSPVKCQFFSFQLTLLWCFGPYILFRRDTTFINYKLYKLYQGRDNPI